MAINYLGAYQDTQLELRILQIREDELRKTVAVAHKVIMTGQAPSSGRYVCHVPLDKAIKKYNEAIDALEEVQEAIKEKEKVVNHMYNLMNNMTGVVQQISIKRLIDGMTLKDIADELHLDYQYVRNVASRHKIAI